MDQPHTKMKWNATYNMLPLRQTYRVHLSHESWRAHRRYAASFHKMTEPNLTTESSELAEENPTLAAQCGTNMNATATSDASLQDGSG